MKKLLVLGASPYNVKVFLEIQQLGYRVIAIDRNPNAAGFKYADDFEVVDITDKEGTLDVAKRHKVDGVMAINDFGVRAAAYVSQSLGLVGINMGAAHAANDKGAMREVWQKAGLPIPDFRVISTFEEALDASDELGFPLVMKPTESGGGGRGISVVKNKDEVEWAFNFAKPFAKNNRIIVESFLDGIEMTIEALTYKGETQILAMSDKYKPEMRYRVATRLNYPAFFSEEILREVRTIVTKAVKAIGIENGASHTEVIVTNECPKLVELGARGGGGHIFSTIVKQVCGVNMVQELAKILTGETPNLTPKYQKGCVYGFFHPSPGIIKAIHGFEEAKAVEGVIDIGIFKKIGDEVGDLINSLQRVGFFVVGASCRDEAVKLADKIDNMVIFEMESA